MNNQKAAILNDFIRIQIAPDYVRAQLMQSDEFDRLIIRCREIREDFTYWLVIEALIARPEFELVSLITGYQTLFSFSIDIVQGYVLNSLNWPEANRLYECVIMDLTFCLEFIQRYFPNNFDKTALVPTYLWDKFINSVKVTESHVKDLSSETTDEQLLSILFEELKSISINSVSFGKLSYLNDFLSGLLNKENYNNGINNESRLLEYCIACNFNSSAFMKHCVAIYDEMLSQLPDEEGRKNWFKLTLKYLYRFPSNNEMSLFDGGISVKEYLINWMEQELKIGYADQKKETLAAADAHSKIHTSISVPVLALLTRSMKDTGIITNSNLQDVFRFFAAHYTSQRKEAISPGSFHGKYYNVEEGTKRKVTDLLLEMVKAIRKIP